MKTVKTSKMLQRTTTDLDGGYDYDDDGDKNWKWGGVPSELDEQNLNPCDL